MFIIFVIHYNICIIFDFCMIILNGRHFHTDCSMFINTYKKNLYKKNVKSFYKINFTKTSVAFTRNGVLNLHHLCLSPSPSFCLSSLLRLLRLRRPRLLYIPTTVYTVIRKKLAIKFTALQGASKY